MHCHQYSHEKGWWQIVFVCSTTSPQCSRMLWVLWYELKQFMRASRHCGALWQLCCAASWLWFLAPSCVISLSPTSRRQAAMKRSTKESGCGITESLENSKRKFDSEVEKKRKILAHIQQEQTIHYSAQLSIYLLNYAKIKAVNLPVRVRERCKKQEKCQMMLFFSTRSS